MIKAMHTYTKFDPDLAASITKAASRQTYFTVRFLVDRQRVAEAYGAYAYFRWVDDTLDASNSSAAERSAFIQRQQTLLEQGYQGRPLGRLTPEEHMLAGLIQQDHEKNSGLQTYLRQLMAVMAFDAGRRGRVISQAELNEYTRGLATAVTEAMHYFIGHTAYTPHTQARYLAVAAAHITHMLRDTFDDLQTGYYNIPGEAIEAHHITPQDVHSDTYRAWVQGRVRLARLCFKAGKIYLSQIESRRARLAGFAYAARFERLLDTIEREDYRLRPRYEEGTGLAARVTLLRDILSPLLSGRRMGATQPAP